MIDTEHLFWIIVCTPGSQHMVEGRKETFGIITQSFSNVCRVYRNDAIQAIRSGSKSEQQQF